ncbi:MAG: hypothetical protein ACKOC8_07430 [Pirellulales bacterium]
MFDVIERLKAEWTDKYVVIDSPAPELARFARSTGQVKTVNMNGRCLVEFDQYNNVGWYDVDPSCLRVVPKPLPKPADAKDKPAKSAAAKTTASKPEAKAAPAAGAKKPSTADILAAARGGAAAKPAAAGGKPSTAEILARARGAKPPATEPHAAAAPQAEAEPAAAEPVAAPQPVAKKPAGNLPTTTADKIAWCRAHDAKG